MPAQFGDSLAGDRIPHTNNLVGAPGGQLMPVGGERHCIDQTVMSREAIGARYRSAFKHV